jgi:hypothetical protein
MRGGREQERRVRLWRLLSTVVGRPEHPFTAMTQGVSHAEWPKSVMNTRPSKPASSFAARSRRPMQNGTRPEPNKGSQSAQRSYERYIALAQAEALSGNIIAAENYYQHAEHYFRLMSANAR